MNQNSSETSDDIMEPTNVRASLRSTIVTTRPVRKATRGLKNQWRAPLDRVFVCPFSVGAGAASPVK